MINLDKALQNVQEWAREVGQLQKSKMNEKIDFHTKSSVIDLVTEVDFLSEKIIIEKIKEHYPEHGILSEEEGTIARDSDYVWVIDPLDGTNNYFHRYPIFGVSIALMHREEALLGVVYMPVLNELFHAVKGQGAYLNGQAIQVSETSDFAGSLMATGFPYDKAVDEANNLDIFSAIVKDIMGIRRSGSAAFDLCCTACGRLDGYWELKIKPWDLAAGELIIKEAKGEVITKKTEKGINVIAGNPQITALLYERIKTCGDYLCRLQRKE